jgi:hypothetical protein
VRLFYWIDWDLTTAIQADGKDLVINRLVGDAG